MVRPSSTITSYGQPENATRKCQGSAPGARASVLSEALSARVGRPSLSFSSLRAAAPWVVEASPFAADQSAAAWSSFRPESPAVPVAANSDEVLPQAWNSAYAKGALRISRWVSAESTAPPALPAATFDLHQSRFRYQSSVTSWSSKIM